MREKIDKTMPAIFLGGSRHEELTTLRYQEGFRSGSDVYLLEKRDGCYVYCFIGLKGTDNADGYWKAFDSLGKKWTELQKSTEQYKQSQKDALALPERLFHYTTIDTLALILKNRTLRFARLDKVNDPEEAKTTDLPMASQAVFSSSWTANEEESLPMWSIYAGGMQGVRIELPNNPFLGRSLPRLKPGDRTMQYIAPKTRTPDGSEVDLTISRKAVEEPKLVTWLNGPNQVRYNDSDEGRLVPCFEDQGDSWFFSLHSLGIVKLKHWSFEEEWRYRIFAVDPEARVPKVESPCLIDRFDLERFPVEERFLDVLLCPDCLREIKVTLGPKVTPEQRVMVESLLQEFAPDGECVASRIRVQ